MPKGRRETFKVEIFPDHSQKRIIDAVEKEASELHKTIEQDLVRQYNSIKLFHSEQEILKYVAESREYFGYKLLGEYSVKAVARAAYASFLERVSDAKGEDIELRRGRRVKPEVEIPMEEVIFSTSDKIVRVPYVGMVRHRYNKNILFNYASPPEDGVSENKLELNKKLRRIFLGTQNMSYYLLMDCTDPKASQAAGPVLARGPSRAGRKLPALLDD